MVRLMQRIRSFEGDSASTSPRPPRVEPPAERESPAADRVAASPNPPAAPQRERVELLPRTAAPKKHIDLSALRELANLSAHSAISQHARRVLIRTIRSKLTVAAVALFSGGALWWMWNFCGAGKMTFYSALLALLVTIYWGVEYALLTGRLIIRKSGHIDWNYTSHGESKSPPAGQGAEKDLAEDAEFSAGEETESAAP
jgi:hypothetical protein